MNKGAFSRRAFLAGLAGAGAASALPANAQSRLLGSNGRPIDPIYAEIYGPLPNERFPIPAVDLTQMNVHYLRRVVPYRTSEFPGTIEVDTANRFLYLTLPGGRAIRYGVGVGRQGFAWSGRGIIKYKKEWPTWVPPKEMIARQPELKKYASGMPPGLGNPLGARALYIFENGRDTLYRLHGTQEARTIGHAVSSGCVRLINQDVINLYGRVPDGTPIVVH